MPKTNKKKYIIGAVAVASIVGVGIAMYATCPRYAVKKALCSESPALCHCYENIVNYRMNDRDVTILRHVQKEIKEYGKASAFEFASPEEVQRLNGLLGVCQLAQIPRPVHQPVQQVAPQQIPATVQPAQQPVKSTKRK